MRLVIDMQGWQGSSRSRGIGRYTISMIKEIIRINKDHEIVLCFNASYHSSVREFVSIVTEGNYSIKIWYPLEPCNYLNEENSWNRKTSEKLYEQFIDSINPDFFLITSVFEGLIDNSIISINTNHKFPIGSILYDLIPLIHSDIYLQNPTIKFWYDERLNVFKKSDYFFSISESAAAESVNYIGWSPQSVCNISTAADEIFYEKEYTDSYKTKIKSKYGITNRFLMYTGGVDHRKNIEGLIFAYGTLPEQLKNSYQLAIVCSMDDNEKKRLYEYALKNSVSKDQIVFTGFVSDEEIVALYNLCHAFVFPSWHEGFGLPVLEALLCGKPVITSNRSSLPEVIQYDDALFDPHDPNDIAQKIEKVLTDETYRAALITHAKKQALKFSWNITANKLLDNLTLFTNDFKRKHKTISNLPAKKDNERRLKLAFLSPVPPERSGISYYSADLIPHLSLYYDIELITTAEKVTDEWISKYVTVHSVEWFSENADKFDRILYQVGNSHFHEHMFTLIKSFPGVSVLHDFYVSGVLSWMEHQGKLDGDFSGSLNYSHGIKSLIFNEQFKYNNEAIIKYPCNLEVLNHSRGIIFHSANSIKLTDNWYGNRFYDKLKVIPLLRPRVDVTKEKKELARSSLSINKDSLVIISLGFLAPTKLNHKLIHSFKKLTVNNNNLRLVFVGQHAEGEYGDEIRSLIEDNENIDVTGWVSDDTYKNWLLAADIGVQLRTMSRGETSAAVLDCMNYGLATIVNSNGSMTDLTNVIKIDEEFTIDDLYSELKHLILNNGVRERLSIEGSELIKDIHSPERCAKSYYEFIEESYSKVNHVDLLKKYNNNLLTANDEKFKRFSQSFSNTFPLYDTPSTYIDITSVMDNDSDSDIWSLVKGLLDRTKISQIIELVYFNFDDYCYYTASSFTKSFFGLNRSNTVDTPVDFHSGNTLLFLNPSYQYLLNLCDYCYNASATDNKVAFLLFDDFFLEINASISNMEEEDRNKLLSLMTNSAVFCTENVGEMNFVALKNNFDKAKNLTVNFISNELYVNKILDFL